MLLGPLLMPIVGWGVVLAVQGRGVPDARWRLDDLTLVDPDPPGQRPRAYKDGLTWQLGGGRTEFTLRHTFVRPPGDSPEPLALYVPSVERNVEVFLNGTKVGDGGPMTPVPARNRHRPLLFTVPLGLLRPGANALDLRVVGDRGATPSCSPSTWGRARPSSPRTAGSTPSRSRACR